MFTFRCPSWLTYKFLIVQLILLIVPTFLFLVPPATPVYAATPPASYGTATHTASANLRIGSSNSSQNFLDPLTPIDLIYKTYTWTVPLSNTTGGNAYLYGWIDFSGSGYFTTTTPATVTVPNNARVVTLTWQIPITAATNITTYVRLRISQTANLGPTGAGGAGEVENYAVRTLTSSQCIAGTKFYYVQGTVSGGSGTAIIKTYDVGTGISTTIFTPPTRTVGGVQIQNVNGLASNVTNKTLYFQDSSDTVGDATGIYGYNGTFFTMTTDASTAPLNITPVGTNGWTTAAGAFANGKYYAGVDGGELGNIYEISLNSAGTAASGAARFLFIPDPGCAAGSRTCRNYGDLMVFGNRMYVALWRNTPEEQVFEVWDMNSGVRISQQVIVATGFALQLARDGNNNVYAITSNNGRVYNVNLANGTISWNGGGSPIRTIGFVVHDAGECDMALAPTAVTLSSFRAESQATSVADYVLPIGGIAGIILGIIGGWLLLRRQRAAGAPAAD